MRVSALHCLFRKSGLKTVSVRAHLIRLVFAAVLPLLVFSALMFWHDVELRRSAIERGMRDTARALSLAVDREVGSILAVAQTLATAPYVNSGDFKAFYDLSAAAAEKSKGAWVVLFDHNGEMIMNTRERFGTSLPNPLEIGADAKGKEGRLPVGNQGIKTVFQTGKPFVSNLFIGVVSKMPLISVTVPVIQNDRIAYALSIAMPADHLTSLLREQALPSDWMSVLVDSKGIIIARTAAPEKFVGRPTSAALMKHLSATEEGWDAGRTQEGMRIYYSFARSKLTGWGVVIGAPKAVIDAPMSHSIAILAGGASVLWFVALVAAFIFGRRISAPISQLAHSAESIHRGETIDFSGCTVAEIEQLHRALLEASAAARAADAEREQRLVADAKRAEAEKGQEALRQFAGALENRVAERTEALRAANIALLRDIEERKKLEEQLIQAQKMESIGTLAGGIAHDFNNILNIIHGYTFLLRESCNQSEHMEESLNTIDHTVQRGAALVQQLLTVAQKTSGKPELIDINLLIGGLSKIVTETFPKNIETSASLPPDLSPIVADKTQMEQVLLNLFVNARDAMPDGGQLTIKTEMVSGATPNSQDTAATDYICIQVQDTGIGMDQNTRNRIFEPFFTTKEKSQRAGLGLAVVYGIIKNHNGFVDVESNPGAGTTFRVYLPITGDSAADLPAGTSDIQIVTTGFRDASTILVVEDEVSALDLLTVVLRRQGYKILKASDGQTALDIFERHQREIDAVLLDLGLPKMAGKDVLLKMKIMNPEIRIVIASGYLEAELQTDMAESGVAAFLQKPYNPDDVVKTLENVMLTEL